MGISGAGKTTSNSGSAQEWAKPYATAAASEVQNVYNAAKPNLDANVAAANDMASRFKAGYTSAGSTGSKANQFYGSVMGGKYLEGNPYLQDIIDASRGGVTDGVNSQFTLAGRYGSGAHTGVLADSLADMEAQLRYSNYATEMDRMMGAAEGSVAADAAKAEAQAQAAQQALAAQALAAEMPYTGTNNLASSLGQLFGGGTQVTKGPGLFGQLLSAGAQVGSAAVGSGGIFSKSDPRLKTAVEKIGEEPDGLGIYEWSYLGSDERDFGVMADEVAAIRPWALGPVMDGFLTVDYDMLEAA